MYQFEHILKFVRNCSHLLNKCVKGNFFFFAPLFTCIVEYYFRKKCVNKNLNRRKRVDIFLFFFFQILSLQNFFDDNDDYALCIPFVVSSVLSFVLRIANNPN